MIICKCRLWFDSSTFGWTERKIPSSLFFFFFLRNWMSIFIFSKRIKTSFAQFCLLKINSNIATCRHPIVTELVEAGETKKRKNKKKRNRHNAAHDYYHTACPFTTQEKQTMDITEFISEWQYTLGLCETTEAKVHLLTNCRHFRNKVFFFFFFFSRV